MRARWLVVAVAATAALTGGTVAAIAAPQGENSTPSAQSAAPKAPVDTATELKYTAVTPCRVLDTRKAAAGPLALNTTRNVFVAGTFGFAPQGGTSGGCGVPIGATSVTATVATVTPPGSGYLVGWAAGTPKPGTSFLNFSAGKVTSTGVTLPIAKSASAQLSLQAQAPGSTQVIMDVTGYYTLPLSVVVNFNGTVSSSGGRVTAVATPVDTAGSYQVTFDRDVSRCAYSVTPNSFHLVAQAQPRAGNINAVYVLLQSASDVDTAGGFSLVVTC
ncbi:hypothetical protein ACXR2U_07420 [Jatrophihabitans sp. YIM 134969]